MLMDKGDVPAEEGPSGGGGRKAFKVLWRMAVEDPFECCGSAKEHDLGDVLKEDKQKMMLDGFRKAYEELSRVGTGERMEDKKRWKALFLGKKEAGAAKGVRD
jgi:3'-phosphoadenosine 5'-phosphosulfate sulfotransferase (PAPS reductase)/FAD synthetase